MTQFLKSERLLSVAPSCLSCHGVLVPFFIVFNQYPMSVVVEAFVPGRSFDGSEDEYAGGQGQGGNTGCELPCVSRQRFLTWLRSGNKDNKIVSLTSWFLEA